MRSLVRIGVVLLVAAGLSACAGQGPAGAPKGEPSSTSVVVSSDGKVVDHVSLVNNLRGRGVTVQIGNTVQQLFLRGAGIQLKVSGGGIGGTAVVESYDYDAAATISEDASGLDADGNPKLTKILWNEPPHFYRAERVLVLYVGSDSGVMKLLTDICGPQFAGR
ncbi:hypothetical protein AB0M43_21465 [Longispora sp. NPDC051575]|uniref:hypothetical protein n=1 Tax=Longispora sp. NPDC051575 TaxID=3154943 RepID=UPI00341CC624